MKCELCPNPATIKHHISYFPEETIPVCEKCHKAIHAGKHPSLIKYKKGDAQTFYRQQKKLQNFLFKLRR